MLFWDTSALVKAYLNEQGTSTVQAGLDRLSGRMVVTEHIALEVLSTLAKQLRAGQIGKKQYVTARGDFLRDFPAIFLVAPVPVEVLRSAFALTHQHREIGVGAMDLLHVSTALKIRSESTRRPLVLASADRGFLDLAAACGLNTFNPEIEPLGALLAKVGTRN